MRTADPPARIGGTSRLRHLLLWPILAALLLGLVPLLAHPAPVCAVYPQTSAGLESRLKAVLDSVPTRYRLPGVAAAMIFGDGSRWSAASGLAEVAPTARPATPRSRFVIGSITKTFVAALVLKLAEERVLRLDDRLSRWVPTYPNASRITLWQLLNHTSGIFNYFEHPEYERLVFRRPTHRWTVGQILSLSGPAYFPPGRGYHYSNTNYILLGLVVEKAGRSSLGRQIRRRFLEPLELRDTFFQGAERVPGRGAMGYLYGGRQFHSLWDGSGFRPNTSAATVAWASGAMVSTAPDVATWTEALYGGQVLEPASLAQMTAFGRYRYGLGTRLVGLGGQPAWGHAGSLRGFTAVTWHLPRQRLTVTVTTNRGRIDPHRIAAELAQVVFESMDTTPPVARPPTESVTPNALVGPQSAPVRLSLSGSDDLSGIRSYELQESIDGSAWRTVLPAAAAHVDRALTATGSYRFRARAFDRAGNVSAWAEGSPFRVTTHGPTSGATARLTFTGRTVAWVAPTTPRRARAVVYLDGRPAGRVVIPSSRTPSRRVVFTRSWPAPGPHTLEVRVTPTSRQPRPGGVDTFVVLEPVAGSPSPTSTGAPTPSATASPTAGSGSPVPAGGAPAGPSQPSPGC